MFWKWHIDRSVSACRESGSFPSEAAPHRLPPYHLPRNNLPPSLQLRGQPRVSHVKKTSSMNKLELMICSRLSHGELLGKKIWISLRVRTSCPPSPERSFACYIPHRPPPCVPTFMCMSYSHRLLSSRKCETILARTDSVAFPTVIFVKEETIIIERMHQ